MNYLVIEKIEDLQKACKYFNTKKVVALDMETTALEPHDGEPILCQLSDGTKTVVINIKKILKNLGRYGIPKEENFHLFKELKELLENPEIKIVIHNSKFEQKWLIYWFDIEPNDVFDTFLAAVNLDYNEDNDPKRKHNLGAVGRRYINVDLDKTEQKSDWGREELTKEQLDYAALDVIYLPELYEVMQAAISSDKIDEPCLIDFECVPCVATSELHGINTNKEKYTAEIKVLEGLRETAGITLQDVLRPTTNINLIQESFFDLPEKNYGDVMLTSSSQMLEALAKLGLPVVGSKETEKIAEYESKGELFAIGTGKKALAPLERHYPVIKLLSDFRGVEKMTSAFGYGFLEHLRTDKWGNDRVHPSFYIVGAVTGRMSARNPNTMQIPNGEVEVGEDTYQLAFRKCFDFPKGRVGVIADYSGIELRIAGERSQDPVFLNAFNTGLDLHALTAATVFNLPYEDCANDKHDYYHKYRAFAKRVNFGIIYGIGAWGLSAQLKNSPDECKEILELHRNGHPTLWEYLDRQKYKAKKNLRARTASGRLIRFKPPEMDEFGKPDKKQLASIARVGTNMPIQGESADILKIALKLVHDRLRGMDACVVNIVHDEIMIECEESIGEEVKNILQTAMKEAGERYLKIVPVKVDAKVISNWGQK